MTLTQVRPAGLAPRSGSILQVQYTQFTGTNTIDVSGETVLTDLTVNITPTSTSSIIKLEAMVNGEWAHQDGPFGSVWYFFRNTTKLAHAASGNRLVGILMGTPDTYFNANTDSTPEMAVYSYFDSPSTTSQITYKVGVEQAGNYDWHLNKTVGDTDTVAYERGISLITATEIAG